MMASYYGHVTVVKLLLEAEADVDAIDTVCPYNHHVGFGSSD